MIFQREMNELNEVLDFTLLKLNREKALRVDYYYYKILQTLLQNEGLSLVGNQQILYCLMLLVLLTKCVRVTYALLHLNMFFFFNLPAS